jgi:glycosyltransferase involved in cell wall biosynthesis
MSVMSPRRHVPGSLPQNAQTSWPGLLAYTPPRRTLGEELRALLRDLLPWVRPLRQRLRDAGRGGVRVQLAELRRANEDLTLAVQQLMRQAAPPAAVAAGCRRPHLVVISPWRTRCGIAEYSRHLLSALSAGGAWRISVLHDDRPTLPQIGPVGDVRSAPSFRLHDAALVGRLALAIAAEQPDCVLIQHHGGFIGWNALADLLRHPLMEGRRAVVAMHNTADIRRLNARGQARLQAALRGVDLLLVHNSRDVGLLNAMGLSQARRLAHGCLAGGEAAAVRRLPPHEAPVIGSVGFLRPHKGAQELIRAASALRGTWPTLRLRLVMSHYGSRDSEAEFRACQRLARRLRFEDHIDWHTGFLPEEQALELLRGCDLLVLPYRASEESSSAAARLAVASLVPTLVSDQPIFDNLGDAVARANPITPGGLPSQIAELLHAAPRRAELQARARSWLAAHDWEVVADILASAIANAPARRGASA